MAGNKVMSTDTRIVKIWDASSGENFTNIEPEEGGDINDVCHWPDSGIIMVASDAPKVAPGGTGEGIGFGTGRHS